MKFVRRGLWKILALAAALASLQMALVALNGGKKGLLDFASFSSFLSADSNDDCGGGSGSGSGSQNVSVSDGSSSVCDFMRRKRSEQESLRGRIAEVCRRHNLTGRGGITSNPGPLVDRTHGIFYCPNAKTGSTTWNMHFLNLTDPNDEDVRMRLVMHKKNRVIHQIFKPNKEQGHEEGQTYESYIRQFGLFSFSFVRHPFGRLVSAFEGKMLNSRDSAYGKLRRKINGSFSTFVDTVLWEAAWKGCDPLPCKVDRHWQPYYVRCAYCQVPYGAVGRLETFDEDAEFVFRSSNLTRTIPVAEASSRRNIARGRAGHRDGGGDKVRAYFSRLSREQKLGLYKLYQIDFEMFGYSADMYL